MSAPSADSDRPELWHFAFSHFNEKVRWALAYKGIEHTSYMLSPGLHVPTALQLSGQLKTPIMRFGAEVVVDSTDILLELERRYPQQPLLPNDSEERNRAIALEAQFDSDFGEDVRTLFYAAYWPNWKHCAAVSTEGGPRGAHRQFWLMYPLLKPLLFFKMKLSRQNVSKARPRVIARLDVLMDQLDGGDYLIGNQFSLADLSACALLYILALPPEYPFQLPQPIPLAMQELNAAFATHPAMRWVRKMYARHRAA